MPSCYVAEDVLMNRVSTTLTVHASSVAVHAKLTYGSINLHVPT